MIEGRLPIKDLPQAWNAKMEDYLALCADDRKAVCRIFTGQAVRRVPVYISETFMGRNCLKARCEIPDLREKFARRILAASAWYRTNLYAHGRKYQRRR